MAYHGQYKDKEKIPAVAMEAIADDLMWVWHMFFGMAGCNNDITVPTFSPLACKIARGAYPKPEEYKVNGVTRNITYGLADGIYPKSPLFMQGIANPANEPESYFA